MGESIAAGAVTPAMGLRLRNLAASVAVVFIACAIYRLAPYNGRQMESLFGSITFSFTGADFLMAAALTYSVVLGGYFLLEPAPAPSKSLRFVGVVLAFLRSPIGTWRRGLSNEERVAVLATLLKSFFAPLMVMSMMVFCLSALSNGRAILDGDVATRSLRELFDRYGFWFLMQLILFVDVLVFTFGYLIELPVLKNRIRSVDPTLMGWAAAILCYPPFNKLSSAILGSPVTDFPQFENPTAHVVLNILLLLLMAIYASASVALGFKGSNLTHRGIVMRGPYRVIRHPAYVCKNMAWWIGSAPLVLAAFDRSIFEGVQATASVAGWTLLYALRAVTEEDHLRRVDGEYAAYAAKVRYRFIPGLL